MTNQIHELRLPAIQVRQGQNRMLYSFAVDGKLLSSFTTISRVSRNDAFEIQGYQRPEVLSHIAEIRSYLESDNPMIPNALVIAFDQTVRFELMSREEDTELNYSQMGTLIIPIDPDLHPDKKPGWIVDGQQRTAAIRDANVLSFPICAVGFIASDAQEQREQFILVNSTKPLPKGLVYELLPATEARLPSLLQKRRFPTRIVERLNREEGPLQGRIRTPTVPGGIIKDNSLIKMLENSLSDGALFRFRDSEHGAPDVDSMVLVTSGFFGAVAEVFRTAWGLPPTRSRLTHGAGIVSMGFVMDAIVDRHREQGIPNKEQFQNDLEPLRDVCRWTDGYWEFGPGAQRKWNEIQNIPRDIQLLANYLLVQYKSRVWNHTTNL